MDVISPQVLVADQATWGFRGKHGSRTYEVVSPRQYNLCPALPELEVLASSHCSDLAILPGCLPFRDLKESRIR